MNLVKPPCDEGVIAAKRSEAPCSKKLGPWILAATILGSSMVFIDGTVVNVALAALQTALGATGSQLQWVVESYALFLSALLLVGGRWVPRAGLSHVAVKRRRWGRQGLASGRESCWREDSCTSVRE